MNSVIRRYTAANAFDGKWTNKKKKEDIKEKSMIFSVKSAIILVN